MKVKQLSNTKWASRNDAVKSVIKLYPAIKATLEYLSENDPIAETCSVAEGLHTAISQFEFNVKILSSYLQDEVMDIVRASEFRTCSEYIKRYRKMRSEEV